MSQPISTALLFPGVDVSGLEPAELSRVHTVLDQLKEQRARDKEFLLEKANRLVVSAEHIKGIPGETLDLINESLKDPAIVFLLENEALVSAGWIEQSRRGHDRPQSHGRDNPMGTAVQEALETLFDPHLKDREIGTPAGYKRIYRDGVPGSFPVFNTIAQSFLGVADPESLNRRENEGKLRALADALEGGLKERKRLLEKDPGAGEESLRMAFESAFVPVFSEQIEQYRSWERGHPVDSRLHYAGTPQAEADRVLQQSKDLIHEAEQIQPPTLEEAVATVVAMRPKKEEAKVEVQLPEARALDELRSQRMASHENLEFRTKPEPAQETGLLAKLRKTFS